MLPSQIKTIGMNGQVSLGKEFAGKLVIITQINGGTWVIKSGEFIPDTEQWLHHGHHLSKLEKALDWAEKNKPSDNFNQFIKQKKHVKH